MTCFKCALPLPCWLEAISFTVLLFSSALVRANAADPVPLPPPLPADAQQPAKTEQKDTTPRFYVQEYRVEGGGKLLSLEETEAAVYPFMGPYRSATDVESARAALEQAYRDKGYQTVSVSVPAQHARSGVIMLQVNQGEVGRVRVLGSRYFSIEQIRREAPSLQEGASPNFTQVTHDLVALNQISDRQITPTVRAGEIPGTVDVDLNVKDTMPLHGSLEINNRYSANTTPLRINGAINYDNLWQLGHSIGASFQLSPEDLVGTDESFTATPNGVSKTSGDQGVKVFSGYYLARVPGVDWLSLMAQGTYQDSNVNTLGGIGVVGKGNIIGLRALITLPHMGDFFQSLSLGIDYKHYDQELLINGVNEATSLTYYPLSAAYSGSWIGKGYETDLNASANLGTRGLGSDEPTFDRNRFGADGSFIYVRGDISHTHDIIGGAQVFTKLQGQLADKPLVNSEQFSGGGLGTVRGYLESEELGDNGIFASTELRSPSLSSFFGKSVNDWRVYLFGEGGILTIKDPLPEQEHEFHLASVGVGTRIKLMDHYNGSFDFGLPLDNGTNTNAYEPLMTFRVWGEF